MKKNVMMRIAACLLVCVLASTCGISGTFAKYVTTNGGSDAARVAKFGVKIEIDDTIFSDSYLDVATDWTENEETADITVQAKTEGDNVVAPGTEGALAGFTVSGTPEVDVEVTYTATLTLDNWEVDGNEYCPIVITVNTVDYYIGMTDVTIGSTLYEVDDIAGLKAVVEAAIIDSYAYYHTNTDLSVVNNDLSVSWRWEYVQNTVAFQTDILDTDLGDQAADGNAATIELEVSMTITQVN